MPVTSTQAIDLSLWFAGLGMYTMWQELWHLSYWYEIQVCPIIIIAQTDFRAVTCLHTHAPESEIPQWSRNLPAKWNTNTFETSHQPGEGGWLSSWPPLQQYIWAVGTGVSRWKFQALPKAGPAMYSPIWMFQCID